MKGKTDRTEMMSFKVRKKTRRAVELLSSHLTVKQGTRCSMTDVFEEAVRRFAKEEKVNAD
jgi:hypothetical protein